MCVGATVPEERLHLLLQLLDPAGGRLLAPVDSELRLYTRAPGGALRHRVVSAVRFSDLEVRRCSSALLQRCSQAAHHSTEAACTQVAMCMMGSTDAVADTRAPHLCVTPGAG